VGSIDQIASHFSFGSRPAGESGSVNGTHPKSEDKGLPEIGVPLIHMGNHIVKLCSDPDALEALVYFARCGEYS